jgi:ElaB/YqjD/DUF883 family membrane-anchored ribosome-binding protein
MQSSTLDNVTDSAINLAHLTHQVSKAKVLLDDAIEDGKRKAERALKRSMNAAEDCLVDTTYFIKRHPWESVGIAVGLGTMFGLFIGWVVGGRGEQKTVKGT